MCLDTVVGREKLIRDVTVYKIVSYNNGKESGWYYGQSISRRKNKAIGDAIMADDGSWYPAGFHAYINEACAVERLSTHKSMFYRTCVRSYIVPSGTTVVFGTESRDVVIVTPVLINPRVKTITSRIRNRICAWISNVRHKE